MCCKCGYNIVISLKVCSIERLLNSFLGKFFATPVYILLFRLLGFGGIGANSLSYVSNEEKEAFDRYMRD